MANFQLSKKLNNASLVLLGLGILGVVVGIFTDETPWHARTWSNVLHNAVFFWGISLGALVFLSTHAVGYGGWHSYFRRIPENMTRFFAVSGSFLLLIALGTWMHKHHMYHWTDTSLSDPNSPHYDKMIAGKSSFLNLPFWTIRMIVIIGTFVTIGYILRRLGKQEDITADLNYLKRRRILGALGFLFFMVFGSFQAWDWLMSIDTHWYSTMYSWYSMASMFVSGLAAMTLIVIYLYNRGYLPKLNERHIHDLGILLFAFSIFWTYLWFSQYMLYWYANIPEETIYFKFRLTHYKFLFYLNLILNFVLPFAILLTNTAKKRIGTVVIVAVVILIGHWLDFYLMVKPGIAQAISHTEGKYHGFLGHGNVSSHEETTAHLSEIDMHNTNTTLNNHSAANEASVESHNSHHEGPNTAGIIMPGLIEILTTLGFIGLFIQVVFRGLASGNLIPKNDPYLVESEHHH